MKILSLLFRNLVHTLCIYSAMTNIHNTDLESTLNGQIIRNRSTHLDYALWSSDGAKLKLLVLNQGPL